MCNFLSALFCYPISFFSLWCPWQWHAWHNISIIHMHNLLVASTCCSIMMLLHCATSNYPLSPLLILIWDTYHDQWQVSVVHQETGGVSAVAVDHKTRCVSGGQPGHPGLLAIDQETQSFAVLDQETRSLGNDKETPGVCCTRLGHMVCKLYSRRPGNHPLS
jgi:hypothetical protein